MATSQLMHAEEGLVVQQRKQALVWGQAEGLRSREAQ